MITRAAILMVLVAMAACGGESSNPLDHVTKFGGPLPAGSPMPADLGVSVATEKLTAGQSFNFTSTSGYGFVEFAPGSDPSVIGDSGSKLAAGSGWTYDAQASITLGNSTFCPNAPCPVAFQTFRRGAPGTAPGNGPALVCNNLHLSANFATRGSIGSFNPRSLGGISFTFPKAWESTGDQWFLPTWGAGDADQSAGAGGLACGWDFEYDSHKLVTIDVGGITTFQAQDSASITSPQILWYSFYFHYLSGGTMYEYHVVQPLVLSVPPPVLP